MTWLILKSCDGCLPPLCYCYVRHYLHQTPVLAKSNRWQQLAQLNVIPTFQAVCFQGNHFLCLPFVTSFMFYVMLCCLYWHLLTKVAQFIHSNHFVEMLLISIFLFLVTFKTTHFALRWKQGLRLLPLRHSFHLTRSRHASRSTSATNNTRHFIQSHNCRGEKPPKVSANFSLPLLHSHTIPAIWRLVNIIKTPSYVCRNAPRTTL